MRRVFLARLRWTGGLHRGEVCCTGGGGGPNVRASMTNCDGGDMCCPIQQLGVSLCLAQCP
ncbi:MAG TPA: hypothetical protein VM513_15525 [Kofleriaceae bacterium]|jgi:hypothetical protein|nr:hypothetical protein [Kofleriaceae bacterium]